jgi:hypoxanthine-guanine phosphoribosyltransferase
MSVSQADVIDIFERVTEHFDVPVPIGGRCESNTYYRVEYLSEADLNTCAEYVAERLVDMLAPMEIHVFLKLPGGFTFFAERLAALYSEVTRSATDVMVEPYNEAKISNGLGEKYRGKNAILVTDVITTARSSLEAHTKATLRGIQVLSWATLIDRTFGPGPVSVVSSFTGAPVRVLTHIG